jgi:hypothetical protein
MKALVLHGRIQDELEELGHVVKRIMAAWNGAKRNQKNASFYLDSVALNLHSFYSGLERILLLVAVNIDETEPAGGGWHRELLRQMTSEIAGLRPAVITRSMREELDEYLSFRHVIRNIYAFKLDVQKLDRLVGRLPDLFDRFKSEMDIFGSFLEHISS